MKIRVTISGRSYDKAAGVPAELELRDGASIDEALDALRRHVGDGRLPASCLVAVSGRHLGTLSRHAPHTLVAGDELMLFAPVAGG